MPTSQIILKVEKSFDNAVPPTRYFLSAKATEGDPLDLVAPLVVEERNNDPQDEGFVRVATLADIVDTSFAENPMNTLEATSSSFAGIAPGDTVLITTATLPELWTKDEDYTQGVLGPIFTVKAVQSSTVLTVENAFPFPSAATGFTWAVQSGAALGQVGTGKCYRESTVGKKTYLRRGWQEEFSKVSEAQARAIAIDTGVQSLVEAVRIYGVTYDGITTEVHE